MHLEANCFKYDYVMKTVLEIVNFIRSCAKTHLQFKNFVEVQDEDVIPNDIYHYCIVSWLSTSDVPKRFVEVQDEDVIPNDIYYYCIVSWLSTSDVPKRFVEVV